MTAGPDCHEPRLHGEISSKMNAWRKLVRGMVLSCLIAVAGPGFVAAQTKPEGEMRFALYVTLAPAWLDPGEAPPGFFSPFWLMYGVHDALVKPMPGNNMAPSLAESWTESEDHRAYEFNLRKGVKFHNGDPFTAEDVVFSFKRAKGVQLHEKVKEVVIVDPHKVRFVLHEPWPDFMAIYASLASTAAWIVPKNYFEKVGADGFKKHPIGAGPYKFVTNKPGIELVMEANEEYWRKTPSVKRLVFQSVPEATTRLAMLKRGEVDIAYLFDESLAQTVKADPNLKLAFSGGVGTFVLDFLDMWDPKSAWADQRVRKAASLAIDRKALSQAATLGASPPNGNIVVQGFEFALPIEPDPYDPAQARKLLAEAGYPNGFDAGELHVWPPYVGTGEAITGYLGAVGIRTRMRTAERAAFLAALTGEKARRAVHVRAPGLWQCFGPHGRDRPDRRDICLWWFPRHRCALHAAADRDRSRQARGNAASDSAVAARAHPVRADLRLCLAERGRPAGRGTRVDADQPVPVGGAARRSAAEASLSERTQRTEVGRT
jgi:peptide/nickel transport system substrate-binding protein